MLSKIKSRIAASSIAIAFGMLATPVYAQHFKQTNLVTDTGVNGTIKDTDLRNVWGLSRSSGGPWWVSNNASNTSTLYLGDGSKVPLTVTVPGGPTGTVFNYTTDFAVGPSASFFLFVAEDGSVSAWPGGPTAAVVAQKAHAVYKGMAIGDFNGANYLYAANFNSGQIDILDKNFNYVSLNNEGRSNTGGPGKGQGQFLLSGYSGYAPFNIQNLGGTLFVTYAKQDSAKHDEVQGPSLGLVAAFTTGGRLIRVFERGAWLNAPWGLAMAPGDFGPFSHKLLVGNFGSGQIAAYNLETGTFDGLMLDAAGKPLAIDGLWGISFGNNAKSGPLNTLFFSAGPNDEANGLLGTLTSLDAIQGNGN